MPQSPDSSSVYEEDEMIFDDVYKQFASVPGLSSSSSQPILPMGGFYQETTLQTSLQTFQTSLQQEIALKKAAGSTLFWSNNGTNPLPDPKSTNENSTMATPTKKPGTYTITNEMRLKKLSDLKDGDDIILAPWAFGMMWDNKHYIAGTGVTWANENPMAWGEPGAEIIGRVDRNDVESDVSEGDDSKWSIDIVWGATDHGAFSIKSDSTGAKVPLAEYGFITTDDYKYACSKKVRAKDNVSFDSVIMADNAKTQILEAISQVDHTKLIFETWGFEEIFEKGTAISLLFWGGPGTGKTLMAKAIADKFGYALEVISTADIETPEPGGAERNLQKFFKESDNGKTVLLFDEADSLVGDRKNVGMIMAAQINCLLTELEKFNGIVIFTTNRIGTLDPAFDRRVSLKLEFPMPEAPQRLLIWKRMFPTKAPLARDIRWEDLSQIEIAGGHIKNVVLAAARMAAHRKLIEITDDVLWECLEKEIASSDAFTAEREKNTQVYGTPLPNHGHDLVRGTTREPGLRRG